MRSYLRADAQFCPWSEQRFEISRPVGREEHATRVLHAAETGVRLFDVIVLRTQPLARYPDVPKSPSNVR